VELDPETAAAAAAAGALAGGGGRCLRMRTLVTEALSVPVSDGCPVAPFVTSVRTLRVLGSAVVADPKSAAAAAAAASGPGRGGGGGGGGGVGGAEQQRIRVLRRKRLGDMLREHAPELLPQVKGW
jgi:hypothetical protein